jgi:hypothetical protein
MKGQTTMAKEQILQWAETYAITLTAVFVPFSQSRFAHEKSPSLNWRVTILTADQPILTTDFTGDYADCPSYNDHSIWRQERIKWECEHGYHAIGNDPFFRNPKSRPFQPDLCDALYSLTGDTDVLNHATFEDWAREYAYDPDNRKVEAIYRAYLEIALKLRNALGDAALTELAEACQDY